MERLWILAAISIAVAFTSLVSSLYLYLQKCPRWGKMRTTLSRAIAGKRAKVRSEFLRTSAPRPPHQPISCFSENVERERRRRRQRQRQQQRSRQIDASRRGIGHVQAQRIEADDANDKRERGPFPILGKRKRTRWERYRKRERKRQR